MYAHSLRCLGHVRFNQEGLGERSRRSLVGAVLSLCPPLRQSGILKKHEHKHELCDPHDCALSEPSFVARINEWDEEDVLHDELDVLGLVMPSVSAMCRMECVLWLAWRQLF